MATNSHAATIAATLARVLGKKGYGSEVSKLRKADLERRDRDASRILGTDTIRDRDIDAAKLLTTTLGGQRRAITLDDLRAFSSSANKLGKRFKGGITARGIIDHSLEVDRDRANREIRTAVVVKASAGMLHFVTNAGPDSDVTRHHVHVDFPAFKAYASAPLKPDVLARRMLDGPLRFECDCGRFTFWYRFLATKGGFVHGRAETGFPRIRNPKLVGVSCKHGLRVMQALLKDANVKAQAAKMIAAAQRNDTKAQTVTAAEAQAIARKQLAQSHHVKNIAETSAQVADRKAKSPAGKIKALQAATKEAQRKAALKAKAGRRDLEDAFKKLATAPLTKAMRDALIAQLKAAQTID